MQLRRVSGASWYAQYSISVCSVCQLLNKYTLVRRIKRIDESVVFAKNESDARTLLVELYRSREEFSSFPFIARLFTYR